jgi:hypothetical protein
VIKMRQLRNKATLLQYFVGAKLGVLGYVTLEKRVKLPSTEPIFLIWKCFAQAAQATITC